MISNGAYLMSRRGNIELLCDIQEAIKNIFCYTEEMSRDRFQKDLKTRDAVIRNFEIIGEATKQMPKDFKDKYENIPWRDMARFRDKLIHHYSGIDIDNVWDIIEESLPALAPHIDQLIRQLSK